MRRIEALHPTEDEIHALWRQHRDEIKDWLRPGNRKRSDVATVRQMNTPRFRNWSMEPTEPIEPIDWKLDTVDFIRQEMDWEGQILVRWIAISKRRRFVVDFEVPLPCLLR